MTEDYWESVQYHDASTGVCVPNGSNTSFFSFYETKEQYDLNNKPLKKFSSGPEENLRNLIFEI